MRVLILGGTGLTGPYTVQRLHDLGHQITVFHRGEHEAELPPGVRHIHGDLTQIPPGAFDHDFDVVVHMWALTDMDAASFLNRFRGSAGRAVVISSGDVYRAYGRLTRLEPGPPGAIPLTEDAPLRESRYPYRKMAPDPSHWMNRYDKILVEQTVMNQTDLPTCVLRFPAVLGPKEHRRFHRWLQPMLRGDAELRIQEGWAAWRWTHDLAENVAEAVLLAATRSSSAGRIYNVGEPQTPAMRERLAEFARVADWKGQIVEVPASEVPEDERMPHDFVHHIVYSTERIRAELGYREVVPSEEALRRVIAWEHDPAA